MARIVRLALAAALTALSAGLGAALLEFAVAASLRIETVDDVVAVGVAAAGLLVLAWYTLTGVVACLALLARIVAAAAAGAGGWHAGEEWLRSAGAPLLRRLAVAGVAGSVSIGALAPAWAAPEETTGTGVPTVAAETAPPGPGGAEPIGEGSTADDLPLDLGWPVSDTSTDGPGTSTTTPGTTPRTGVTAAAKPPATVETSPVAQRPAGAEPTGRSEQVGGRHVVQPGESLWSITAAALRRAGLPAGDSDVAASWPRLYEANAAVVGPDPDLILPGQDLHIPSFEEEQ